MTRKKKDDTTFINQMSLFDNKELEKNNGKEKNNIKIIDKGELLEYQIKRLFFFMGYYSKTNIMIQSAAEEPCDTVTDLDVYGHYIHRDFSKKTIWADCKSGAAQEINRVAWLIGIKDMIDVDDILFVKKGTKLTTKMLANRKNIQIVDLSIISEMERKYGVKKDDWRGPWNFKVQNENMNTFKSITVPENLIYKRIFKFLNTHYWALEDNFTKCKKTITALRDLASLVGMPLSQSENKSVKWAIYQLTGMLMLAMLQICRQVQYFPDRDKIEIIDSGLIYGSNSKTKIDDILKVTNNIALKTMQKCGVDEQIIVDLPEIKLNRPEYTEAFTNMIFRISENPMSYFDILRFVDFVLLQYDLENEKYDINELNEFFGNVEELMKSAKTYFHFICHVTNMPKEVFVLLQDDMKK